MLDIAKLTVDYGKHRALDAISLRVQPSELVVMLGANGAGKSTLLRALGGMMRPNPGARITLAGEDLLALPPHRLVDAGIALVPEGRGLFTELSVKDNLLLGALPRRARAGHPAARALGQAHRLPVPMRPSPLLTKPRCSLANSAFINVVAGNSGSGSSWSSI